MRTMKRNRGWWTWGAAALGLCMLASTVSAAPWDPSIEQSGSIVVWPKVVWDGTRDTIIQLSNTGNPVAQARCFYIDGEFWSETDFHVFLTKQQPTQWIASTGRRGGSVNGSGFKTATAGFSPGLIPPVRLGFKGELKCVQVDDSEVPIRSNQLKGEATLRRDDGDVTKYNAIALRGNPGAGANDNPNQLDLNWAEGNQEGQYSACPNSLLFNHIADGAPDLVVEQLGVCSPQCFGGNNEGAACTVGDNTPCTGGGVCRACPVTTELTLVPCQEDLENLIPGVSTVQFEIKNEFEQPFSTSTTVDCWLTASLSQIHQNAFSYGLLGTFSAYTRINPNPGDPGVLGIAEESRSDKAIVPGGMAAFNLQIEGNRYDDAGVVDQMILPVP